MAMCRVCLVTGTEMIPFDEYFVSNYNRFTDLNVKLYDGLPQHSCRKCTENLKLFIDFRSKAISSESYFKEALKNKKQDDNLGNEQNSVQHNNHDDPHVKLEIKTESSQEPIDPCDDHFHDSLNNDDTDQLNEQFLEDIKQGHVKDGLKNTIRKLRSSNKKSLKKESHSAKSYTKEVKKKKCKTEIVPETKDMGLSCGLCKKMFGDANDMKSHLETHKISLRCKICQYCFSSWQEMFGHRMLHVPTKQRRCHICNKYYVKYYTLEYHYLKEHSGDDANSQEIALKCNTCAKTYGTPCRLRKHILHSHKITKHYCCDFCSKRCSNKNSLRVHIASHSNTKLFVCDKCDFSCNFSGNLKTHIARKHSPEKSKCIRCESVFVNQYECDKHRSNCLQGVDDFMCSFCGKQFKSYKSMKRHLRTHNPEKQYKCDRCPSTYRTKAGLRVHVSRHDGRPAYKCRYCPQMFYGASSRVKHHRKHTGEKPYVCNICGRGFASNYTLKFHMKTHGLFLINHVNKDLEELKEDK